MKGVTLFTLIPLLLAGCANITTPSGGPRDKKPPRMETSIPANNHTNFKGREVVITFNEYVKLNNPKEEIIISPSPSKNVEIKVKGYRVIIKPEDPWQDTTTYSILFREGVQDITESNSPQNLKLAFSTGPSIDSLSIAGTVNDHLKGTPSDKITVAIYSQDTFNIFNHTPAYFTKTNKLGQFRLDNIKKGTYHLYAFDDKNKNLKVDSRNERYGFIPTKIQLNKTIDTLEVGLIMMDSRKLKMSSIRNIGTITRVRLNKNASNYYLDPPTDVVHAFADKQAEIDKQTEIIFWNPGNGKDSLQLHLFVTDSLESTIDSIFYIKKTFIKPIKETFRFSLGKPTIESETGKFTTTLKYSKPISNLNFDSIYVEIDTTHSIAPGKKVAVTGVQLSKASKDSLEKAKEKLLLHVPIRKQDVVINEIKREITVNKNLDKSLFSGDKDPRINLKARSAFLFSIDNDTSKAQVIGTSIFWPEDTGILNVQVETKEKNFIIQLLDHDGKEVRSITNETKAVFKNLPPTDYQIRIVIDKNKNGKWDPGYIGRDEGPEKVVFYKTPDAKQFIAIRANWEIEPLIIRF